MSGTSWWSLIAALYAVSAFTRDVRVFLFTLMLTVAAVVSALWARYSLAAFHYSRKLGDDRLFFGEETDLEISVYNAKPLPLPWVLINDQYPGGLTLVTGNLGPSRSTGFARALVNFLALRSYERVRRIYRVRGDHRGVFRLGPAEVYAGDVFGFRRQHMTVETVDHLVVYPKIVPVTALGLPAARPAGEVLAERRIIEDPLRYAGVREYAMGDSMRHVHWKATARTQQLQTRTFDPSACHSLMILLDVQTASRPYSLVRDHLELLITAAASLTMDALDKGYSVGLLSNGGAADGSNWTYIPPGRHPDHSSALLEALAWLSGFRLTPFSRLLAVAAPNLPFGATVVALSAQAEEEIQEALLRLRDSGHPVVLIAVGEEKPEITPEIQSYYIGGTEAWLELETLELA